MSPLVIGHKNPDTDAVCSAIGYADLLQRTGQPGATAACCGEVTPRTLFALREAGLTPPPLVLDIRPTVQSIGTREVISARPDEPLFAVFNRMDQARVRALPVVDGEGKPVGLITLMRLMELFMPDLGHATADFSNREIPATLRRVCEAVGGTFLHPVEPDRTETLVLTIAAMSARVFEDRLGDYPAERLLVVTGDRPTVQRPAIERGVRCLIITGGHDLEPALLVEAQRRGVAVIRSPRDTANTALLARTARFIGPAIEHEFIRFTSDTLLSSVHQPLRSTRQTLFPVVNDQGVLERVWTRSDLLQFNRRKLVLVDHNELTQAVTGADEAEIVEVIDHHRLGGGLKSNEPIRFINEPVGSTSTIVAGLFKLRGLEPSASIALCLAAGIISDTLKLTSPTTTQVDRDLLPWLMKLARRDLDEFATAFFAAGSVLQTHDIHSALTADSKDYQEAGWKIAVAQIEELDFNAFWLKKEALRAALHQRLKNEGLHFACLLVTDITLNNSVLLAAGPDILLERLEYPRLEPGLYQLNGVVSRKKQLLPYLMRILASLPAPH